MNLLRKEFAGEPSWLARCVPGRTRKSVPTFRFCMSHTGFGILSCDKPDSRSIHKALGRAADGTVSTVTCGSGENIGC